MRAAPFIARWSLSPQSGGAFDGRMVLDDPVVFAGHYPGAPIFPGTFLVEALVQAAGRGLDADVCLEQIVACRFRSPLFPGDEVFARFVAKDAGAGRTLVEVTANGRAPAAELTMLVAPSETVTSDAVPGTVPESKLADARALDFAFIESVLPHRGQVLLVERALALPGTKPALLGLKTITSAEPCFGGTASPTASYPHCLVIESFCQSCGLLRAVTAQSCEHRDPNKVPVVAKLANLRFFGDATVGDQLEHRVRLVTRTPDGAVFSGETAVSGRVIMQVERVVAATAAVTAVAGAKNAG